MYKHNKINTQQVLINSQILRSFILESHVVECSIGSFMHKDYSS